MPPLQEMQTPTIPTLRPTILHHLQIYPLRLSRLQGLRGVRVYVLTLIYSKTNWSTNFIYVCLNWQQVLRPVEGEVPIQD